MELKYWQYSLEFKHPFTISSLSRTETKVVYVELYSEGHVGYGEAALPPYLPETQESVIALLKEIDPEEIARQANLAAILHYVDSVKEENYSAKAALDMAIHDLYGKKSGKPLHQIWNIQVDKLPPALFTIGISKDEKELEEKINASGDFSILKLKTGKDKPVDQVKKVREFTGKDICIDVNQGWNDREKALEWINRLADEGVLFVEQPLPKENLTDLAWLSSRSPIPLVADESFQTIDDIDKLKNTCRGINIKLMKCGGLDKARLIIEKAKQNQMTIIMGCMSESSCGVAAAAQLTPFVDYADLDGPLLIKNDPFEGVNYEGGKINLSKQPGTGAKKISK
ncbi:MAG: dipeptide epimerase [Bacteroidia bacterium]